MFAVEWSIMILFLLSLCGHNVISDNTIETFYVMNTFSSRKRSLLVMLIYNDDTIIIIIIIIIIMQLDWWLVPENDSA